MPLLKPRLIGTKICPFAQRSVIALREKGIDFDLEYIDLAHRPSWFEQVSPQGKVPVLRVGDASIFESAVINEYLDEVYPPRLHPQDPLRRAHDRAWIEFASALTIEQYRLCLSVDADSFTAAWQHLALGLDRLEAELNAGPYFNGRDFALVDTAYAPLLMRLNIIGRAVALDAYTQRPRLAAYCAALLARPSVAASLLPEFESLFTGHFRAKDTYFARCLPPTAAVS
jgi:glutathione S-transferase